MKHFIVTVLAVVAVSVGTVHAGTTLINSSFETGDLTGWSTNNGSPFVTTSYQTYGPIFVAPWDDYFAVVPAGCPQSTLYQSFAATAGSTIIGWSFFQANDYLPYDDTGQVKLIVTSPAGQTTLFTSSVAAVGSYGNTPWVPWIYTFQANGTYEIRVESTNTFDCAFSSAVGIDIALPGGMVTGGGWINSPAGAYKPDPSLKGKANFGFVSQYKKGTNVPTGNTEFQFQAGDLNFHSNSYEWLIVNKAGTNAQFKGVGTVNGAGNYGFMLWADDNASVPAPDAFRIKIWDENNGDAVVYDNGVKQSIDGGNIVVHNNREM